MIDPWRLDLDRPNTPPRWFPTEAQAIAWAILNDPSAHRIVWYDAFDYEHHNAAGYTTPRPRSEAVAQLVRDQLTRRLPWLRLEEVAS